MKLRSNLLAKRLVHLQQLGLLLYLLQLGELRPEDQLHHSRSNHTHLEFHLLFAIQMIQPLWIVKIELNLKGK